MKCKNYLLNLLENIPLWFDGLHDSQINLFPKIKFISKNNFGAKGSEVELFWGGFN
jgi:hypothetical protein